MSSELYYIICACVAITVLVGIGLMSKVKTAVWGNRINGMAVVAAVIVTLLYFEIFPMQWAMIVIMICLAIGVAIGLTLAYKVKMIHMPQTVGMLNGIGGAASALVGGAAVYVSADPFGLIAGVIALIIGTFTFAGSLIAAGKLAGLIGSAPVIKRGYAFVMAMSGVLLLLSAVAILVFATHRWLPMIIALGVCFVAGVRFASRIGGADMPITIALLNSLSGVAAAVAGLAMADVVLVSVGAIVGASGLLLTRIMCRSMNKRLTAVILGKTGAAPAAGKSRKTPPSVKPGTKRSSFEAAAQVLKNAKDVIVAPGYGMALAQAQHQVKRLADWLESNGASLRYAIHPVAGRMPGHMNVLLCEADVAYEHLFEPEAINDAFKDCDAVLVIGANDVVNPAANYAKGTPIYGMPVLHVDEANHIIFCNMDTKPGYAGVDNPLYERETGVTLLTGDAKESIQRLLSALHGIQEKPTRKDDDRFVEAARYLKEAKHAIIVPGYGMAMAQAQHEVKSIGDRLVANGASLQYAIHPVAGRMPGHMNVLLCEAGVEYEQLFEPHAVNDAFATCDVVLVVGANDVLNPAAKYAKSTPIFGMPLLDVEQASRIIFCNYDDQPGYAGVKNPLYDRQQGVVLLFGDAKHTLQTLLALWPDE